ncbi:hypothetical protein DNL40_09910 [Xylanimonas oleitrophica]|uniref:Gluconate 2-dehydrogenase subunit 3 family protein n=1 Tax=Xylanimonas oleitrophica TaxID=2607479 RepID=A0A2W5XSR4_9MICO|nr:gluconate 2-dehydrogenase subunit 3 family protein [Xylanimonas oleitrophica]PZR52958.1 hypothetical protein DNL40_09910 [Xylanimonas oleitrophica]
MTADPTAAQPHELSRRSLLKTLPIVGGAAALAACTPTDTGRRAPQDVSAPERSPGLPHETPAPGRYRFLTEEEARTLEAAVARIAPGDEADPGAVQMGVATYIDGKLADHEAFAEPTYHRGPFAEGYDTDPGEVPADAVPVATDQLYRYGHQDRLTPQETYRRGLAALDRYAQTRFGTLFADLPTDRQDEILVVLDDHLSRSEQAEETSVGASGDSGGAVEEAGGQQIVTPPDVLDQAEDVFGDVHPGNFFATLRTDTIEGMFADPLYGGNVGMAGWALVGWPAAQRSYSPAEMLHGTRKTPQPMHDLPAMNPDRPGGGRPAIEQHQHGVTRP